MMDQKALAYVNMYGIFGALPKFCELDAEARSILAELKKPVAVCFEVKDGPCRTFRFEKSGCSVTEGRAGANCRMTFATPEKFNAMIDSGKPGMPVRGILTLLPFLLGTFTRLTDRLTALLRPSEEALSDRAFFEESTVMTLYVIAGAISALANHDAIGRISAENTVDGVAQLGIAGGPKISVHVRDHVFTTAYTAAENPRAVMEFADMDLAAGLFAGKVSTINEMCRGTIRLSGMISMLDNINRILDRVSVYLA